MCAWFVFVLILAGFASAGFCQETASLLNQVAQVYGGDPSVGKSWFSGLTLWNFIGGFVFGTVGFAAFIYGKKNSAFKPLIVGIVLMGYPYFVSNTFFLYLVGSALCVALFVFRE